jgi:hypothetical protein
MLSLGLRPIMDCFRAGGDGATQVLYFYPPGDLVRGGFINTERYDIGVYHELANGGRTAYLSFPLGLPINSNTGENEREIQEVLKRVGMLP